MARVFGKVSPWLVLFFIFVLVFGALGLIVNADDPAPATVVGTKTLTLRDGLHFIGDGVTSSADSMYFAVADVFYTWELVTDTETIDPYLEFSPDGVIWSRVVLPSIKGAPDVGQITRTALYGNNFRFGFEMVTQTIDFTPTVKVTLKNLAP